MKKESFGRILLWYLKDHRKVIVMFGIFILIFIVVFSLYSQNLDATGYAILLCACVAAGFTLYDFIQYWQRHKSLSVMKGQQNLDLKRIPASIRLIEEDYRNIIGHLMDEKLTAASGADSRQTEMIDFYTLWAHQIKTPISAMRLLLQSGQSTDDEKTGELQSELFKIEQYVEMVLGFLRIESTSSDLVLQKHPLSPLVRQAVKNHAGVFIRRKITLDFNEMDCDVLTDEKWTVFALEQILSNALKYTGNGGRISIYMADEAKKVLCIEDNGIGIAEEDLPRIFEKGFTGHNGRIDKKATGIGLYLCRKVFGRLSHKISITSRVGTGTTVKIDFSTLEMTGE